jgi:hypothetical protein
MVIPDANIQHLGLYQPPWFMTDVNNTTDISTEVAIGGSLTTVCDKVR